MDPTSDPGPFDRRPSGLSDQLDDLIVWIESRRRHIPAAIPAGIALGIVVALLWWSSRPAARVPVEDRIPMVALEPTTSVAVSAPPQQLLVHVAGAVVTPGVYIFEAGDRVIDAVDAAGGARPDADLGMVNLAAPLIDGAYVRIPIAGESIVLPPSVSGPGGDTGPGTVDLNRADVAELDRLSGVGPATASAIVEWRERNGPFVSTDQLLDVPGIGPAKLEALIDEVTVG